MVIKYLYLIGYDYRYEYVVKYLDLCKKYSNIY